MQRNTAENDVSTHNCNTNMFKQGFHYVNSKKHLHCCSNFARTNIEMSRLDLECTCKIRNTYIGVI